MCHSVSQRSHSSLRRTRERQRTRAKGSQGLALLQEFRWGSDHLGGEPLLQWEFIAQVFGACKERGIHTALDTSGYAPWNTIEPVLKHVDLVLYDLKHMDPEIHERCTGASNELVLSNLQKTVHEVRTWIRIPVIPGFNDSDSDIQRIVDFVSPLPVEKVSIIPYHGFGQAKYESMGIEYPVKGTPPPSDDRIGAVCEIVSNVGLTCTVRY
ncbi:radical SAM protein [Chloroflexota bacterium]